MPTKTDLWREKASSLFFTSSLKFKLAATKASSMFSSASDSAENAVRRTYFSTKESWNTTVQPKLDVTLDKASYFASETSEKLKKGFQETKEKINPKIISGIDSVSQATKESLERTRSFFGQMKSQKSNLFGLPLETIALKQTEILIPHIVLTCCEYISLCGNIPEDVFDSSPDPSSVSLIMRLFEQDDNAVIPQGTDACVVAQVLKNFFVSLPEPAFSFELYEKFLQYDGDVFYIKDLVTLLPPVNRATLDCLFHLFLELTKKPDLNVDAKTVAKVWTPLLLWKQESRALDTPPYVSKFLSSLKLNSTNSTIAPSPTDNIAPYGGKTSMYENEVFIDAVVCMIKQHEIIFSL